MAARRILVVGGGLAGLSAALELVGRGAAVTVCEAADRWGGQLKSTRTRSCVIEEGAEAFAATSDAVGTFLARAGLEGQVVRQRTLPSLILLNGRLDRITSGEAAALLGIRGSGTEAAGLATLQEGMDRMATGAVRVLTPRADLRLGEPVLRVAPDGHGWQVQTAEGILTGEAVLLAVRPEIAATLVAPLDPEAGRRLTALPARASLTVSCILSRDAVSHPLDATGFVVPPDAVEENGVTACTFASAKFPGRTPDDRVVVRAFFRPAGAERLDERDAVWTKRALALLTPVLGIRGQPLETVVSRWPRALPEHGAAYAEAVAAIEAALERHQGLRLAGSGYHMPGVEGAVRSGAAQAERLAS